MMDYTLKATSEKLILERKKWVYDEAKKSGEWVAHDVTDRASEFLFKEIELEGDIILGDIFKLIELNPLMKAVFKQDFVNEMCDEIKKHPTQEIRSKSTDIEYLELYQVWSLNSKTKEYEGVGNYRFHGVGFVQKEDLIEGASEDYEGWVSCKKGDRIQWSISMSPLLSLLHLPVRFNPHVDISEDDRNAKLYMRTAATALSKRITLGSFIHEVLWELSWHGSPDEVLEASEELNRRYEEFKSNEDEIKSNSISHEDVFESLGFRSRVALYSEFFEGVTKDSCSEISKAVHDLDNEEPAGVALKGKWDGELKLKSEFEGLTGYELREKINGSDSHK